MTSEKEILPDNPAARLLSILKIAVDIEFDENAKAGDIWAKVLRVNNTPSEFFPVYAQLFTLTSDAYEKVVDYYPNQQSIHAGWRNKINNCLQSNSPYHHPWLQLKKQIQAIDVMDMLQIAADNLAHYVTPTTVNELSIEELKGEFNSLKDSILDSESLSDQLKKFLVSELEKILNCLEHYDLYGSVPVKDAIYNIVSNIEINQSAKPSIIKKLGAFLIVAASSIAVINDVADVPESLVTLRNEIFIPLIDSIETDPSRKKDIEIKETPAIRSSAILLVKDK